MNEDRLHDWGDDPPAGQAVDDHPPRPAGGSPRGKTRPPSFVGRFSASVTMIVLAAVLFGGLPALGAIWLEYNQQVEARLLDTLSATQALYTTSSERWLDVITMIGERPTLCSLAQAWDAQALSPYIETLRLKTPASTLLVLDGLGHSLHAGAALPEGIAARLDGHSAPFVEYIKLDNPARLVVLAASPMNLSGDCASVPGGWVLALDDLDDDFMHRLASQTGMQQSLVVEGVRLASSMSGAPPAPLSQEAAERASQSLGACCTQSQAQDQPYYVGMAPLLDGAGQMVALIEVALPGKGIYQRTLTILGTYLGAGALIALLGAVLARSYTARLTRPLDELAQAAQRLSRGELDEPVPTSSDWLEINHLALELEASRQQLRDLLRISHEETRQVTHVLNGLREGILTLDEQGRITWLNQDAGRMLGYRPEALYRRHIRQVLRSVPGETVDLERFMDAQPDPPATLEMKILDGRGQPRVLALAYTRLSPEPHGERTSDEHVLVLRDVSQEQHTQHLRAEVMGSLAHEFRTPLSSINATIELLEETGARTTPEELSGLIKAARLSTLHLQALVDNILESAIIESGFFRLNRRPVRIHDLIREVSGMLAPLIERRGQTLKVTKEADLPVIWLDPERVKQVLINLLSNASKFSPSGTTISVAVQRQSEALWLAVSDQGPGLPSGSFDVLFNRFYTGSQPRGARYGVGLGLAVVKTIVEAHQGQVGAENCPEGGARVWFTLPLSAQGGKLNEARL